MLSMRTAEMNNFIHLSIYVLFLMHLASLTKYIYIYIYIQTSCSFKHGMALLWMRNWSNRSMACYCDI